MSGSSWKPWVAAMGLVMTVGGVAHARVVPMPAPTAVEQEARLTLWRQAIRKEDRLVDQGGGSEVLRAGLAADRGQLQKELLDVGILADGHAWPAGCLGFKNVLANRLASVKTAAGLDEWADWRHVYLVSCQVDASRNQQEWSPLVARALAQLPYETLQEWPSSINVGEFSSVLLRRVPDQAWTCMAAHVSDAVRQGLDRHEGLRYVARVCQVDDSVFGEGVSCMACGAHPRLSVGRTNEALVSL